MIINLSVSITRRVKFNAKCLVIPRELRFIAQSILRSPCFAFYFKNECRVILAQINSKNSMKVVRNQVNVIEVTEMEIDFHLLGINN